MFVGQRFSSLFWFCVNLGGNSSPFSNRYKGVLLSIQLTLTPYMGNKFKNLAYLAFYSDYQYFRSQNLAQNLAQIPLINI